LKVWPRKNGRGKRRPVVIRELITLLGFKLDDGPAKKYDKQIDSTKEKQQSLFASMFKAQALYNVAGRVIGSAFSFIRDTVIGTTEEIERYRVALGTMIGDQEKANQIIHDLDYSPLSDFYGTANAIGGLQGMVTFGMQAEEASNILTRLGDIAQGDSAAFVSMSRVMGQVFAKGKADATALKQFVVQGFDVVGEVAKQSGKSRDEIEKTGVTYEQTVAALRALTSEGGKYNGMLDKQMNTLGGLIKRFASLKAAIAEAIGSGISDYLKDILRYTLQMGKTFQDAFVQTAVKGIKTVMIGIATIIVLIKRLNERLTDVGGIGGNITAVFSAVFDTLKDVIRGATPVLFSIAEIFIRAFGPVKAFIIPVLEALKPIVADVFGAFNDILEPVKKAVTGLTDEFGFVGDRVADLLGKVRPVLNNIMAAIKAAFEPIRAFVLPIIEALKPVIADVFSIITDRIDDAGEETGTWAEKIKGLTAIFQEVGSFIGGVIGKLWEWRDVLGPIVGGILAFAGALRIFNGVQQTAKAITKGLKAAQLLLNAAWLANPVGIIIALVIGVIAAFVLLYKKSEGFRNFIDGLVESIKGFFAGIGEFFTGIGEAIGRFFTGIKEKMSAFFSAAVEFVRNNLVNIVNIVLTILFPIAGIVMALVRLVIKHWDKIKGAFTAVANAVVAGIKAAWEKLVEIARTIFDRIVGVVRAVVDRIRGIWQGIVEFIAVLIAMVKLIVERIWNGIVAVVQAVIDKVKAVWQGIVTTVLGVVDTVKSLWQNLVDFLSPFWDWLGDKASSVWEGIKNAFAGAVDFIRGIWDGFVGFFTGAWDKIKGAFTAVAEFLGFDRKDTAAPASSGTPRTASSSGDSSNLAPRSLTGSTAMSAASPANHYSNSESVTQISVNSNITTAVPVGTPAEQATALRRQAHEAVQTEWAQVIQGARGMIPSPESGRAL
jgi:phage-related protein